LQAAGKNVVIGSLAKGWACRITGAPAAGKSDTMVRSESVAKRETKTQRLTCDLAIVGGGLAGTCCAITAARAGLKVTLI
jgi:NADPH-dependent 2,4-dienoyl-CoA reductase/sulfur reductase-like enzyme